LEEFKIVSAFQELRDCIDKRSALEKCRRGKIFQAFEDIITRNNGTLRRSTEAGLQYSINSTTCPVKMLCLKFPKPVTKLGGLRFKCYYNWLSIPSTYLHSLFLAVLTKHDVSRMLSDLYRPDSLSSRLHSTRSEFFTTLFSDTDIEALSCFTTVVYCTLLIFNGNAYGHIMNKRCRSQTTTDEIDYKAKSTANEATLLPFVFFT
jgi:hypothetical protein